MSADMNEAVLAELLAKNGLLLVNQRNRKRPAKLLASAIKRQMKEASRGQ